MIIKLYKKISEWYHRQNNFVKVAIGFFAVYNAFWFGRFLGGFF
ncbi:hypothetical protein LCGC14_0635960 [marine sediment metagenome]|uniref:Uncharacterized protein n=1 Tax=marine sediment metagenome TaxID=412755 RepID=A0A0F9U8W4_9ZZZZ